MTMFRACALVATACLALAMSPAVAQSQTAPAGAAKATTSAGLSADTPLEVIVANPQGKAVLAKYLADFLDSPMFEVFKAQSLRQLEPQSGGRLTPDMVARMDAELKPVAAASGTPAGT